MTIGKKLATLLLLAMTGLLISGLVGLMTLSAVRKSVDVMNRQSVPALIAVGAISDHYKEVRALLLALVMEEDSDLRQGFVQKIQENTKGLASGLKDYQAVAALGVEEQIARAKMVDGLAGSYIAALDGVIKIVGEGKKDEALAELYTKVIPAEVKLTEILAKENAALIKNQRALDVAMTATSQRSALLYVLIVGVMLVLVGGMGWFLYQSIMAPLSAMQKTMRSVVQDMDFRIRAPKNTQDELGEAVDSFNALLERVQSSLQEVAASVQVLSQESDHLTEASTEIRHISTQSSEAAASVASTVEELTVSINLIAERTRHAQALTATSGRRASDGGQTIQAMIEQVRAIAGVVHAAAEQIQQLQQQTGSISSVVNVIREVADQTNLLALNAAIEAARAGEQGRGFAVVADEVRKLAERTAQSTQEIAHLISGIQQGALGAVGVMQDVVKRVESGVADAGTAIDAVESIRHSVDEAQGTVSEIAYSIQEQNQASNMISGEMERLALISEEATHAVTQTSDSAQELQSLSNRLKDVVARYRI